MRYGGNGGMPQGRHLMTGRSLAEPYHDGVHTGQSRTGTAPVTRTPHDSPACGVCGARKVWLALDRAGAVTRVGLRPAAPSTTSGGTWAALVQDLRRPTELSGLDGCDQVKQRQRYEDDMCGSPPRRTANPAIPE